MCIIPQGGPPPTGDPHGTLWLPGGSRSRLCRMKPKDSHGNPRDPKRTPNPSSRKTILDQTTTIVPSTLFSSPAAVTLLFTIFILLLSCKSASGLAWGMRPLVKGFMYYLQAFVKILTKIFDFNNIVYGH